MSRPVRSAVRAPVQDSSQRCEGLPRGENIEASQEPLTLRNAVRQTSAQESSESAFPAPASLSHSHHSSTRSIYFSSKGFQHQYASKQYCFLNQRVKTACTRSFPLFPSASQCLSWLSHVFPGYKPSCSCKPRSEHMSLHGMFAVIFSYFIGTRPHRLPPTSCFQQDLYKVA